jgi:hypothetical protein
VGPPLAVPPHGVDPSDALWHRPSTYKLPPTRKTLNESGSIHEKFHNTAAIEDQFRGTELSVLAPCRDGELPLEPSPSNPPPSPLPLLSPIMMRE